MSTACPISFEPKIDSTLLRINALFYIIFLWSAVLLDQAFFILPLIIIFLSKNINMKKKCLIDYISKAITQTLKLKEVKIDPAPKKLANAMGLVGSISLFLVLYFQVSFAFIPIAVMSIAFGLEAIFDYCIGCKLYALTQLLK